MDAPEPPPELEALPEVASEEPEPVTSGKKDPFINRDAGRRAREIKRKREQLKLERKRQQLELERKQKEREYQLALQRQEIELAARRQRLAKFKEHDGGYYLGQDPSSPEIGDSRIKFSVVPEQQVSVLAQQQGAGFTPYRTSNGGDLYRINSGEQTAAEMFHQMELENAQTTWILRGVGFFLMFLGLMMVFRPLVVVADVIPLFGSVLSAGSFVFAFLLAAPLTLTTIAVSWFAVRPILTVALLFGAGFFGYLALKVGKRKRN